MVSVSYTASSKHYIVLNGLMTYDNISLTSS